MVASSSSNGGEWGLGTGERAATAALGAMDTAAAPRAVASRNSRRETGCSGIAGSGFGGREIMSPERPARESGSSANFDGDHRRAPMKPQRGGIGADDGEVVCRHFHVVAFLGCHLH